MNSHPPFMRPEHELLFLCGRRVLGPSAIDRLQGLAIQGLHWNTVLEVAEQHRVSQLLWYHLERVIPQKIPAQISVSFRLNSQRIAQQSLALSAELLRLYAAFDAAGVLAIPYKGPTLAVLAFGNPCMRDYSDLDFLVPHSQIDAATSALKNLKYEPVSVSAESPASTQPAPGQYQFLDSWGGTLVELHTEKTLRYFPVSFSVERLHDRGQTVTVCGREIQTLDTADLLVFLSVHGAKHFWNRLQWIADVVGLCESHPEWDFSQALGRACEFECEKLLLLAFRISEEMLGFHPPHQFRIAIRQERGIDRMTKLVWKLVLANPPMQPGILQRMEFRARMRNNLAQGLAYSFKLATTPTEDDRGSVGPTGILSPLYSVLRPFRLLREHGIFGQPHGLSAKPKVSTNTRNGGS